MASDDDDDDFTGLEEYFSRPQVNASLESCPSLFVEEGAADTEHRLPLADVEEQPLPEDEAEVSALQAPGQAADDPRSTPTELRTEALKALGAELVARRACRVYLGKR